MSNDENRSFTRYSTDTAMNELIGDSVTDDNNPTLREAPDDID
jgi:hypothetical protein